MVFNIRQIYAGISLVGLALVASLAMVSSAYAIEGESITLSPVSKEHTIKAGSVQTDFFTVINDGTEKYEFIVYSAPYSVSNYDYSSDYTTLKDNTDAFQWVQFDETSWTLEPGDRVDVQYTLRVPSDAAPGGHYGIMFAETQPKEADGTQVLRKKRVGSQLRVTVEGDYVTAGKTIDTNIDWLQFTPPVTATAQIENTGNVDFDVKTTIRAKDVLGNVRYTREVENIIFPKTIRDIKAEWATAPWFGLYNVEIQTEVLDKTETSSSYVLIAPRWLLIVMALALIGGVYGAIVSRKTRR